MINTYPSIKYIIFHQCDWVPFEVYTFLTSMYHVNTCTSIYFIYPCIILLDTGVHHTVEYAGIKVILRWTCIDCYQLNAPQRVKLLAWNTITQCHRALLWRHNDRDGVSYHQPRDCLLNRLFRRRSKKTSKLRVTGLCAGNSPVTGEFPAQWASNAENVSIWWHHHGQTYSQVKPHSNTDWRNKSYKIKLTY